MRHITTPILVLVALLLALTARDALADQPGWLKPFGTPPQIALVEATSRALLDTGEIDFALSVDIDVDDARVSKAALEEALGHDATSRHILAFSVAQASATRRVLDLTPVQSTIFLGYANQRLSINPDDPAARFGFTERLNVPNAALTNLTSENNALGAPLLFEYAYDKANIRAQRTLTVHAYLIDRVEQTYVTTMLDASESQNFEVAYRVSRYDPNEKRLKQSYDSEKDVDDFERAPFSIKLSQLLKAFGEPHHKRKRFANVTALRAILLTERNDTLARLNANTFDDRPLNDPRFDSVVAIYSGRGTMGSGFFVAPDVVLTNWHVVEDHEFVEMKMYDGQETFGTVLGKDARLDVALIRVQNRGRPVAFYTGKRIDVGQSVEAIGHPHRHEFSITRGVISAVRKHNSINLPKGAGDDVLFIQTDAPINSGNSGGPLFLGQRVVGMNTWGAAKHLAEGLNFSIHYAELVDFLREHLPGYTVDPAGD